jgi:hypothetical protein
MTLGIVLVQLHPRCRSEGPFLWRDFTLEEFAVENFRRGATILPCLSPWKLTGRVERLPARRFEQ